MKIFNSLKKQKQKFISIKEKEVKMYVCGITAYDYCHIGHARSFVAFDIIIRYLIYKGYKVTFVRNITDIDDKIINKSIKDDIPIDKITSKYILHMQNDIKRLNLLKPNFEPKATDYINQMIEFRERRR